MKTGTTSTALLTIALIVATTACGSSSDNEAASTTNAPSTVTTSTQPSTPTTSVERPTKPADKKIGVDRGALHIRCNGRGPSTVVLIAGWDTGGDAAWSAVQPKIAEHARVCSYDKFGTGTSDPAATPQTFATEATDLRQLLDKAGEPGPYVVVGHSFGGSEAVEFASRNRKDVVGLMLIDASPTTWPAALCAVPTDGGPGASTYQATCDVFRHPRPDAERLDAFPAFAAVAKIKSLGELPMTVVTAADRSLTGLSESEFARLTDVWNAGVARWATLSSAAKVVSVKNTGHDIQLERPGVVLNELTPLIP